MNVLALAVCTREAVKSMRERNVDDGHIIHISRFVEILKSESPFVKLPAYLNLYQVTLISHMGKVISFSPSVTSTFPRNYSGVETSLKATYI